MSELFEDESPQEAADRKQAVQMIDPGNHLVPQFNYFLRRLEEVRSMGEDEVPEDASDAWVFKDSHFVDASRAYYERFSEAADAVAKLLAAERALHDTRDKIEHEVGGMLIAQNQISFKDTLTTADFPLRDGDPQGPE